MRRHGGGGGGGRFILLLSPSLHYLNTQLLKSVFTYTFKIPLRGDSSFSTARRTFFFFSCSSRVPISYTGFRIILLSYFQDPSLGIHNESRRSLCSLLSAPQLTRSEGNRRLCRESGDNRRGRGGCLPLKFWWCCGWNNACCGRTNMLTALCHYVSAVYSSN